MRKRSFRVVVLVIGCWLMLLSPAFAQETPSESTQQQIDKLIQNLKSPSRDVRASAAVALGKMGSSAAPATPALVETLKDKDSDVRQSAAYALKETGPSAASAAPALTEALKDKNSLVCAFAAIALGNIGSPAESAVPALTEALKDKHSWVRQSAAAALGKMGSSATPAAPALSEALKDEWWQVRASAAIALDKIGSPAASVVSALADALKDKDEYVRINAAEALGKIAPDVEKHLPKMSDTEVTQALSLWQPVEESLIAAERDRTNTTNTSSGMRAFMERLRHIFHRPKPTEGDDATKAVHRLVDALAREERARQPASPLTLVRAHPWAKGSTLALLLVLGRYALRLSRRRLAGRASHTRRDELRPPPVL